jgi:hypothetical protein
MDLSGRHILRKYRLILCILLLALAAAAQNTGGSCQAADGKKPASADDSIAAAARSSKNQKAHAKKVFSDEDMEAWSGPLPRLKMEGTENSDELMAAITLYRANHTAEQTERVVRIWYERYDEILAAAIQNNIETRALRTPTPATDTSYAWRAGTTSSVITGKWPSSAGRVTIRFKSRRISTSNLAFSRHS